MKVGDLIRIKSPRDYPVGAYHSHLFDETMLVMKIIDEQELPGQIVVPIEDLVECVSESGVHRFPVEDMEIINEAR